jgi:hypothetical protein
MVASDAQLDFFSLSWVWDILHPNWEMLCDDAGNYLGPVPVASKFGLSYRLQPFFIRALNFASNSEDSMNEILEFLSSSARYLHLNFSTPQNASFYGQGHYQLLDLNPTLEEIRNGYSSNAKRMLKKIPVAYRVEKIDSPSDFVSFFKKQKGEELSGFTDAVWKRLSDLLEATKKQGHLSIFAIKEHNEILAAGVFLSYKGTCYFLKGTATSEGKKNGAMYALLDQVISVIQATHETLDFVGSNNEAIAQFYRKFGATNKSYSILKRNNLPRILKLFKS